MKSRNSRHQHKQTAYIQLDTNKFKACWKCLDTCSNKVLDSVNILWHKHAHIVNGSNCTGCLECVNVCESNALSDVS